MSSSQLCKTGEELHFLSYQESYAKQVVNILRKGILCEFQGQLITPLWAPPKAASSWREPQSLKGKAHPSEQPTTGSFPPEEQEEGGLGFPPNPEASRQLMEPLGSVLFWEGRWVLLGRGTGHRRLISYKGGHQVQGRRQWHNCPHPKSPIQPLPRHMGDCWVFSHGVEVLAIINEVISIKTPPWHGQVTSYLKEKKGERGGDGWSSDIGPYISLRRCLRGVADIPPHTSFSRDSVTVFRRGGLKTGSQDMKSFAWFAGAFLHLLV